MGSPAIQIALDWGVGIILWLQRFSPDLDQPFRLLSLLGSEGFYLFLFPLVYWCIDRRIGARLAVLFLFSAYLNDAAKAIAHQPRPFQYSPMVRAIVSAGGGGLPSGHTQHSVVVWGYLASVFEKPWAWCIALFLMLAIPLSRLYLGVHFPTDLLGGYLLGAVLLILYRRLELRIETWMIRKGIVWQLCLAITIPALLVLVASTGIRDGLSAGSALVGMGAGMALERRWLGFQTRGPFWKRSLRFVIGIAISFALWGGMTWAFSSLEPEAVYRFLRYSFLGFFTAVGAPWLFFRLHLVESRRIDPTHRARFQAQS